MLQLSQHKFIAFLFIAIITTCYSCNTTKDADQIVTAADYRSDLAHSWYDLALQITPQSSGFTAPVTARAMGYMGVTLYESVVWDIPNRRSLSGVLTDFDPKVYRNTSFPYYAPAVANAAMASIVRNLYAHAGSDQLAAVDALELQWQQQLAAEADAATLNRSQNYGKQIAQAVFDWSKTDSGHQAYLNPTDIAFVPATGPGRWNPTAAGTAPLHPYWGNNRPFVPTSVSGSQPAAPRNYTTVTGSPFYQQAYEVYSTTQSLTPEQFATVDYWADETGTITPAGHSIAILKSALEGQNVSLAFAAEAYCKLGIGLSDAFVSAWKCKYQYSLLRPVTYIKQVINPAWSPLLNTPASPEYTAEHAVQAGAMATILTQLLGSDYMFTDFTHQQRTDIDGSPRNYVSFDDAAHEAAFSRLYAGVHYRDAVIVGLTQGKILGMKINALDLSN